MSKWEEVSQDEFLNAQNSFLKSKEGFFYNLSQSARNRAKEISSLGGQQGEDYYPASFGGQLGKLIGRTAADVPAIAAASAGGPLGLAGLLGYGYATTPGDSSERLGGALLTAGPLAFTKGIKNIPNVPRETFSESFGEKIPGGVKEAWEDLRRPGKIEEEIQELKPEKEAADLRHKEGMEKFINDIDESIGEKKTNISKSEELLNDIFGDQTHENLRGNVVKNLKDIEQNLLNKSRENYQEFDTNYGDLPIENPIDFSNIGKDYGLSQKSLKKYPELKPIIERLSPDKTVGSMLGQPQKISHSVRDYLSLYRALRDLSRENRNQSRMAIGQEKANLLSDAKSMDALRKEIENLKLQSLPEEGKKSLKNAQDFYKNYIVSMREHNPTQRVLQEGIVPNNYFDTLNQPGVEDLRNEILSNPDARDSLVRHSFINKNLTNLNPQQIDKILNTDAGKLLPEEIRSILNEYGMHKKHLSDLQKIKSNAPKSQVRGKDAAMKELLDEHPEFAKPFSDLKEMQERMRSIERELIQKGLDKKEAEKAAAKYWKIVSAAKTIKAVKSGIFKWLRF